MDTIIKRDGRIVPFDTSKIVSAIGKAMKAMKHGTETDAILVAAKVVETIVRAMHDAGIGYGTINHPVARAPVCGYGGVIDGDTCPKCGRRESESPVKFERIRRITGYLVGTLERFNDAKRAEERDRVKHGLAAADSNPASLP
ncbi:MAG: hypothetical protein ILO10_02650 [Kiritimatiellae bacterium]|nr:hypothetical protein [Kiritimatiellia bacterium]